MSSEELRAEALRLLRKHAGSIPGSPRELTKEEKDELWQEMLKEVENES